jgi:hypothetical protein
MILKFYATNLSSGLLYKLSLEVLVLNPDEKVIEGYGPE